MKHGRILLIPPSCYLLYAQAKPQDCETPNSFYYFFRMLFWTDCSFKRVEKGSIVANFQKLNHYKSLKNGSTVGSRNSHNSFFVFDLNKEFPGDSLY